MRPLCIFLCPLTVCRRKLKDQIATRRLPTPAVKTSGRRGLGTIHEPRSQVTKLQIAVPLRNEPTPPLCPVRYLKWKERNVSDVSFSKLGHFWGSRIANKFTDPAFHLPTAHFPHFFILSYLYLFFCLQILAFPSSQGVKHLNLCWPTMGSGCGTGSVLTDTSL